MYRKDSETTAMVLRWENGEQPVENVRHRFRSSELVMVFKLPE